MSDIITMLPVGRSKAYQLVQTGAIKTFRRGSRIWANKKDVIDYVYEYETQEFKYPLVAESRIGLSLIINYKAERRIA